MRFPNINEGEDQAILDANLLYRATKFVTNADVFNDILSTRNPLELRKIFEEYERFQGNTIEETIEKKFSGALKDAYLIIGTLYEI